MKKFRKITLFLMTIVCLPILAYNTDRSINVSFKRASYDLQPNEEEEGRRKPTKRLDCIIDYSSGITFFDLNVPEILSYELYDENEICLGLFDDEMEFVHFLFTLNGEYKLRFNTNDYYLEGYIFL